MVLASRKTRQRHEVDITDILSGVEPNSYRLRALKMP